MREKLSLRSKLSFGIGAFGKDMVYAIVSTFFMKYLTDYRLVDPLFVAVLFAAARIRDAVNDTFMGVAVDNRNVAQSVFEAGPGKILFG